MPAKLNTRDHIISTAKSLFYHKGYGATSYGHIAKSTGHAVGNIQYYFKTKKDILEATINERSRNIEKTLQTWSQSSDMPYERLLKFIDMVEENAKDLARYGCPVGTLNDELGKDALDLQMMAKPMLDLYLLWLNEQFLNLFPKKIASAYAEHLLCTAQGASLLTHAYNDQDIIQRQMQALRAWLKDICDQ